MLGPEPLTPPLVQARAISKRFGGVRALDSVDLELRGGEVHALLGENGAGKSTLVKIISGVEHPDAGQIELGGATVCFGGPADAQDRGISIIHQEFNLLPNLTVGQNIYLGREPRAGWRIDWPTLYRKAEEDLARLGLRLPVRQLLGALATGEQQMVAIARALSMRAGVLILDEPTAALNEREIDRMFESLARFREAGVGILYISHRLQEIGRIADRATVLRDGRLVGTVPVRTTPPGEIVRMMVGQALDDLGARSPRTPGDLALEARGLDLPGRFGDVSLSARRGEVVGLGGLMGAGHEAFARAAFGLGGRPAGELRLFGRPVRLDGPATAMRHRVGFVPPDRKQAGLCLQLPIRENALHASLRRVFRAGLVTARRERQVAEPYLRELRVVMHGSDQLVGQLSGGNQQKVALAKWLLTGASLYILFEPTRGVDVGTKAEIHTLIDRLAREGVAILLVTSDLPELTSLSDRIYVFRDGRVVGELGRSEISQERVLQLAAAEPGPPKTEPAGGQPVDGPPTEDPRHVA